MVPLIIAAVVAVGFLTLWLLTQQKLGGVSAERDDLQLQLDTAKSEVAAVNQRLKTADGQVQSLQSKRLSLEAELEVTGAKLADSTETLRKRTELADAQALQIDGLSGERDDLRRLLQSAEERIVTLAARPGVVVGAVSTAEGGPAPNHPDVGPEVLWDLEVVRSERLWRNSVAIDPDATSPFDDTDDAARQAVEIEAAALREDVGALITVDWQAPTIESAARRLLVVRLAQEMLATASRAPGAARLLVTADDERPDELNMRFVADDAGSAMTNLIPPQVSSDLIDVRNDTGLSITLRSGQGGETTGKTVEVSLGEVAVGDRELDTADAALADNAMADRGG